MSDQAARDGYIQVAGIFRETAGQECEHALRFFKFFNGGELEVTASFLTGVVKDTKANLVAAADLEKYVHSDLYPGFAKVAREEGLIRPADVWDAISVAEVRHEETFRELAENVATNRAFRRESSCTWPMHQLRIYPPRQRGAGKMPGLRASVQLLRGFRPQILTGS